MQRKISLQICSYNRKDLLRKTLGSLSDQTFSLAEYEVIVVDDGSTDGTSEMLQEFKAPYDLILIRQEKSGLAAGRNKGIKKAEGDIILFIDDDVLADPNLIKEHFLFHERHPNSIVKGWVNHVEKAERPAKPKWTWKDFSTAAFWTSNVSVKKSDLLKAGLFDEDFKEYGWEDLELGLRLKQLGLATRYNPKAIGYHYKKKLKETDIPSLLKQAEAKGRTAVLFVKKQPVWRAKLSTGIHPARLALDAFLSNPLFLKIYQNRISRNGKELNFWSKYCAQSLASAYYFKTIRKILSQR
jgi:glycosyltransferase involved in cell wall biosynthesis